MSVYTVLIYFLLYFCFFHLFQKPLFLLSVQSEGSVDTVTRSSFGGGKSKALTHAGGLLFVPDCCFRLSVFSH